MTLEFALQGGDFENAGEASSKLKQVLQRIGLRPEVIRRIAICAYEAEMNVIIHAYQGLLQARIFPDHTEITVRDTGPGIPDIALAMQEGYSTAPDHIREMGFGAGMGLPNIARSADTLHIDSVPGEGTRLYIVVKHERRSD